MTPFGLSFAALASPTLSHFFNFQFLILNLKRWDTYLHPNRCQKDTPDKVADQISDAVLDKLLAYDPSSKVACETLVTTGQVVLAGEVKTKAYVDLQLIAREVIKKIGYTKGEYMFESNSCGVLSAIHEQSPDINRGVERQDPMEQGAGDQGMMFGYATNETENYMPLSLDLAHRILQVLADIRREGKVMTYLRPDAKSQVTIEYDDNGDSCSHRYNRCFYAT